MDGPRQRESGAVPRRVTAAVLVGLALVVSGCTTRSTPIDYYWFEADGQLVIQVETAGDLTTTKAIGVDETEDTVTITVWTETAPLPMAGMGVPVNLPIDLPNPLGGRQLVDGSRGTAIELCHDIQWCTERGGGSGAKP